MRELALEALRAHGRRPPPPSRPRGPGAAASAGWPGSPSRRGARSSWSTPRATCFRRPGAAELAAGAVVVSAATGAGHRPAARAVREQLPEREFAFDPDDLGTQPLRFFVVEYLREAAFELLEDELPYAFTAEVEEFREADGPCTFGSTLFVERESQKGIVIGQGGRPSRRSAPTPGSGWRRCWARRSISTAWVKVLPQLAQAARRADPLRLSRAAERRTPSARSRMSLAPSCSRSWSAPSARATWSTGPSPSRWSATPAGWSTPSRTTSPSC